MDVGGLKASKVRHFCQTDINLYSCKKFVACCKFGQLNLFSKRNKQWIFKDDESITVSSQHEETLTKFVQQFIKFNDKKAQNHL